MDIEKIEIGKYINHYIKDLTNLVSSKLNVDTDKVSIEYKCECDGKIHDSLLIEVFYDENEYNEKCLSFRTNSLSLVFIDDICSLIKEMMGKDFITKDEAEKIFKDLYYKYNGLYLLELKDYLNN